MKLPAVLAPIMIAAISACAAERDFYVGTYTKKEGSKGIYHFRMDADTGAVTGGELAAESESPSFLAVHPNGKYLYAANEADKKSGVSAYAIGAGGKLESLGWQSSKGAGACHVSVDPRGRAVFVANYTGGSIAAFPIKADGSIAEASAFVQHTGSSVNPQRQKEPHAHSIYPDVSGRFVYSCDLGTDKIYGYRYDGEKGVLNPDDAATAQVAPGSGPRHFAFHPKAPFAYCINEMANTVTAFARDENVGGLKTLQTVSTLPENFTGSSSTAEIFVRPDGKFLYGSNRGHDSIAIFSIADSGKLTLVAHTPTQGNAPRNFALDPEGKFLLAANQGTDNFVVFRIDGASGKLTPTGQSVSVGAPVCIVFAPVK